MKLLQRLFAACLAVLLLLPAARASSDGFSDVPGSAYCYDAVTILSEAGILKGYSDGTFRPGGTITRAEMAAVICRLARLDTQSTTVPFQDVSPSDWAAKYIAAAYQAGSIRGSGGRFRPNDPVSYPEAVKMIVCAAGLGEGIPSSGPNWAEGYLAAAQEHGITDGLPDQTAVRGNVALMAYNALYRPAGAFGTYKLDAAGQIARDYCVTRDGGYSLRLSSQVPNHLQFRQIFTVEKDRFYILTAYIKTEALQSVQGGTTGPVVTTTTGPNRDEQFQGDTDWTKVTRILYSGEDGTVDILFNLGYIDVPCTGALYVADITLEEHIPAETTDWDFLFVVFTHNDITYTDENGRTRRETSVMSSREVEALKMAAGRLEEDWNELGNGMIRAHVDVLVTDVSLTGLVKSDYGYWLDENGGYELLRDLVDTSQYDHITAVGDLNTLKTGYWGLTGGSLPGQTGYSFINTINEGYCLHHADPANYWYSALFIHEALHFMSNWTYRLTGEAVIDLHAFQDYGYTQLPVVDNLQWYTDFIRHDVPLSDGGTGGIPARVWAVPPSACR